MNYSTGGYPLGAIDDPKAPYNEKENPEIEISVCVSMSLHKNFKIKVKDYTIIDKYKDEDGDTIEELDFSTCNLNLAAQNLNIPNLEKEGWLIDEFEIIKD